MQRRDTRGDSVDPPMGITIHAPLASLVTLLVLLIGCSGGSNLESDAAATPRPPTGFVNSDGYRIYYEVEGEGHPLVLVHGWSSSIEKGWRDTGWIDALSPYRQVIAIDIRGHGESDKPHVQEAYSYGVMARDVIAVMDYLGVERADFVGYSLGAFSGTWLLGRQGERFSSAVLMGIGDEDDESIASAEAIASGLRAPDSSAIEDVVGLAYRAFVESDPRNDLEALALAALQMWPEGFPRELGGPGLADLAIPVLVLNGANDVPYVDTDELLAAAIPAAMLVEIPAANHLSVLTDPRFRAEVINFLPQ